jgi:hypothetical protein
MQIRDAWQNRVEYRGSSIGRCMRFFYSKKFYATLFERRIKKNTIENG